MQQCTLQAFRRATKVQGRPKTHTATPAHTVAVPFLPPTSTFYMTSTSSHMQTHKSLAEPAHAAAVPCPQPTAPLKYGIPPPTCKRTHTVHTSRASACRSCAALSTNSTASSSEGPSVISSGLRISLPRGPRVDSSGWRPLPAARLPALLLLPPRPLFLPPPPILSLPSLLPSLPLLLLASSPHLMAPPVPQACCRMARQSRPCAQGSLTGNPHHPSAPSPVPLLHAGSQAGSCGPRQHGGAPLPSLLSPSLDSLLEPLQGCRHAHA